MGCLALTRTRVWNIRRLCQRLFLFACRQPRLTCSWLQRVLPPGTLCIAEGLDGRVKESGCAGASQLQQGPAGLCRLHQISLGSG